MRSVLSLLSSLLVFITVKTGESPQRPSSQQVVTNTVWIEIEFIQERMNPTNKIIAIDLFGNAMPKTVNNFMKLCDPTN
jgi:hypothetical protein